MFIQYISFLRHMTEDSHTALTDVMIRGTTIDSKTIVNIKGS